MFTSSTTTYSQGAPVDVGGMLFTGFSIFAIFVLLICVIPFWKIFRKAGFPPALSLLMPIPGVNLVLLYILAFADWPSLTKISGRLPRDPDPLL